MKISLIATVLNEEETIGSFLTSIFSQTQLPDEIIIVDGGSRDSTVAQVQSSKFKMQSKGIICKIFTKKGNRAVGRNEAVRCATGDIIVCSDSGCIPDKDWVKNITKPFTNQSTDVVAGYYRGRPSNIFEKCLVPYVLVMPDRVDPKNFLPASRSMAFRKSIWEKVGGFPEKYSYNEDYVFVKKLKAAGAKIIFAKDAIVSWLPRKNLKEAFRMFFRFAYGDMEAHIIRPKVIFLFARYLIAAGFFISVFTIQQAFLLFTFYFLLFTYLLWSILKNYHYVDDVRAVVLLPVIQLACDIAVITGSTVSFFKRK